MRIQIKVTVFAVSKEDFDRTAELIDELWDVENVFQDEYGSENDIEYSVDEGIEGE